LAGVGLRTGVAVIADGAVRLRRIRADTRRLVADADIVALIGGGTDDRIAAGAGTSLAGVGTSAGVAVIADGAIGLRLVLAFARFMIANARFMALIRWRAFDRVAADASASLAGISLGAGIVVTASAAFRFGRIRADTCCGVADADPVALIGRGADDRIAADAFP
jgi:hypothetical protein